MFLSGVLFVLFLAGAIAWGLTSTRHRAARRWPQKLASQLTMGNYCGSGLDQGRPMTAAEAALARHPASQARRAEGPLRAAPIGPDDDPEFLRLLDQRIKGTSDSGELPKCLRLPNGKPVNGTQIGPG